MSVCRCFCTPTHTRFFYSSREQLLLVSNSCRHIPSLMVAFRCHTFPEATRADIEGKRKILSVYQIMNTNYIFSRITNTFIIQILLVFFLRSWDGASWYISIVKPNRCTIFEFIEYDSTCFGRSFRPPSGVQDSTHSIRYMSCRLADCLQTGTRWNPRSISCLLASGQLTCMTYTWCCVYSL